MKMHEALEIMNSRSCGYLVRFDHVRGKMLHGDYFPDVRSGEKPIDTKDEAWALAGRFASKTRGKCVDIYIVHADDFTPVAGYQARKIENREKPNVQPQS